MTSEELKETAAKINAITDISVLEKSIASVRGCQQVVEDACDQAPLALALWGPVGFLALQGVPYAVYMEKAWEVRAGVRHMMAWPKPGWRSLGPRILSLYEIDKGFIVLLFGDEALVAVALENVKLGAEIVLQDGAHRRTVLLVIGAAVVRTVVQLAIVGLGHLSFSLIEKYRPYRAATSWVSTSWANSRLVSRLRLPSRKYWNSALPL